MQTKSRGPPALDIPVELLHKDPVQGRGHPLWPELKLCLLSKRASIDPGHLSRILSGRSDPSVRTALRLSRILGMSMDTLLHTIQHRQRFSLAKRRA